MIYYLAVWGDENEIELDRAVGDFWHPVDTG
jgi:hypothetical protein